MKNKIFSLMTVLVLLMFGCTFDPVRPQAVYQATATARAASQLPTVTPTPTPEIIPTLPFTPTAEIVPPTPTPECTVKGNIDAKGNKIYHLPGDPNYDRTKPEACFPDAASAEAAGYRPIKR